MGTLVPALRRQELEPGWKCLLPRPGPGGRDWTVVPENSRTFYDGDECDN